MEPGMISDGLDGAYGILKGFLGFLRCFDVWRQHESSLLPLA